MEISPLVDKDKLLIRKISNGRVLIGDFYYENNFVISNNKIIKEQKEKFSLEQVLSILSELSKPEVLIYGFGDGKVDLNYISSLNKQNINFDVMDTNSACRTYNILVSEDRDVLLILNLR
jgi:uncharacterized protein